MLRGDCQYEQDSGFLKQQAASSSNVGGAKLCVLNGGLNYQIEHHLFPRIAHSRLSVDRGDKVRPFVTSKGGQYVHFDTVWANLRSVHKYQCGAWRTRSSTRSSRARRGLLRRSARG